MPLSHTTIREAERTEKRQRLFDESGISVAYSGWVAFAECGVQQSAGTDGVFPSGASDDACGKSGVCAVH